jgi:hypothetical protein
MYYRRRELFPHLSPGQIRSLSEAKIRHRDGLATMRLTGRQPKADHDWLGGTEATQP